MFHACAFASPAPKPPRKDRKWLRQCIVTRRYAPKSELFRIVRTKSDKGTFSVQLNFGNGRSAYIARDPNVLAVAQKKNMLSRSLRCFVPPAIFGQMQAELSKDQERSEDPENNTDEKNEDLRE